MTEGLFDRFGKDIFQRLEHAPVEVTASHSQRGPIRLTLTLEVSTRHESCFWGMPAPLAWTVDASTLLAQRLAHNFLRSASWAMKSAAAFLGSAWLP